MQTLKYELTEAEVNFLLNALNKVQLTGIDTAKNLLIVTQKLQNPANAKELDKAKYEELKTKFDEPKKK